VALLAQGVTWMAPASAQQRAIDIGKSAITVHVYKAGVFSALGHDHEIAAQIDDGTVDSAAHLVHLRINARSLRVKDPNVSKKERDKIEQTMFGSDVLDVEHYSEIVFRSTVVEPRGASSWRVRGDLTLHGQSRPVAVDVRKIGGALRGNFPFQAERFRHEASQGRRGRDTGQE
jgi:polyisoprenoid-binding protein YceI